MSKAKCTRCGGIAEGKTFEEASSKIDHAVGLSRGRPCGNNYGCVIQVDPPQKTVSQKTKKEIKPKEKQIEPIKE